MDRQADPIDSERTEMAAYGQECVIDVHDCNVRFDREKIKVFCVTLCNLLEMEREDLHFWDYDGDPEGYANAPSHLKGISAVQFIKTSSITLHSLDDMRRLYLNVFSCKPFDAQALMDLVLRVTQGTIVNFHLLTRV